MTTLTLVSSAYAAPGSFAEDSHVSLDLGSGAGRIILAFGIMAAGGVGTPGATYPDTVRAGSTSGAGGTLLTAGSIQDLIEVSTTHNYSRVFSLDSADIDTAGAALTGTKEVWLDMTDGNGKPGLWVIVLQSDDGSELSYVETDTISLQAGSGAVTQAVGSPGTDEWGIVFVRNNGAAVATASSGNALLAAGQTDTIVTVDAIAKPGTGSALSVGWVPGDNFQWQARHWGTLTATAGGGDATATGVTVTAAASLIAGSASGTVAGTASGVTLSAAASLIAGSASGVVNGTLDFQAAGMEFGARTGLGISTFALDNGVSYRYTIHADGLTLGNPLHTSSAENLDSAGKLANYVGSVVAPGTTYRVVAIRQTDGEAAVFRVEAS